ncbi:hypothetical protein PGTUg99_020632 [Puccinia graminis f. sp. tritici]|uniref:Uncharacterized protein n=1 Tax=Puccinia graminis f. sp. tritici TaxID=56615 RepID=A0A5B0PHQ3_PUCGR|nr:hypothetical protein PGTUg99_020632 [Puccinia graminis f. sp. tritici]
MIVQAGKMAREMHQTPYVLVTPLESTHVLKTPVVRSVMMNYVALIQRPRSKEPEQGVQKPSHFFRSTDLISRPSSEDSLVIQLLRTANQILNANLTS